MSLTAYGAWCLANVCKHGHCPLGCEHPQPGYYAGPDKFICGVCYFEDGTVTEIVPCVPATCKDAI